MFSSYIHLGMDFEAKEQVKEIASIDPSFEDSALLDLIFQESGIEGIIFWLNNWLQTKETAELYYRTDINKRIAHNYGIIGDSQNAMEYLEKAFEAGESLTPYIKFNPDFSFLREDPRFISLLKKMDL
jgi:hypothetical protein